MSQSPTILSIETSSPYGQVSVSLPDNTIFSYDIVEERGHAQNILVAIETVLSKADIALKDLDAIALSFGPGSYTGLRIGASTAKGLATALDIPLININTLYAMACYMIDTYPAFDLYLPMLDARRMEVYTLALDNNKNSVADTQALLLEHNSFQKYAHHSKILCFGSGIEKFEPICSLANIKFLSGIVPKATYLHAIANSRFAGQKFDSVTYSDPFYLKEVYTK